MNARMLGAALALLTIGGCSLNLNGKKLGGGGGSTASGGSSGGGGGSRSDAPSGVVETEEHAGARNRAMPDRPADPWAALDGDRPKVVPDPYQPQAEAADCSAAHDHCLPDWVWFVEKQQNVKQDPLFRNIQTYGFRVRDGVDEFFGVTSWSNSDKVGAETIAYRTVPAAKKNLKPGVLVMVKEYPAQRPDSEADSLSEWRVGTLDRADLKTGKLLLVGHDGPYWISAARVVALTWRLDGGATLSSKLKKADVQVAVGEVIQPAGDVAKVADPWAEVGKDGQPRQPDDSTPYESAQVSCDGAHDHCLRPWVWFVESYRGMHVARFRDGAFHSASSIDKLGELDSGMAYRTKPATAATLKVGKKVVYDSLPMNESDAMGSIWSSGKVKEIQPEVGMFRIEGDDRYYPIDTARVLVLQWFPGEQAEAVP